MTSDLLVRGTGERSGVRRRWTGPLLALVVVAIGVIVAYDPPTSGDPFDPTSRGPLGLAVLVDVLAELDVEVEVTSTLPAVGVADVVLSPPLGWTDEQLLALAADGTRVVAVVPPAEDAVPIPIAFTGVGLVSRTVECDLLSDVEVLRSPSWTGWQTAAARLPEGSQRCVVEDDAAWATLVPREGGELLALGTFAPLVNDRMFEQDTAVAAVSLLGVTTGDLVVVLDAPAADAAPPGLLDLIDRRWFDAAWLTLLVLVLLALARGRRLGQPVSEELPVRVPSGELARATGDLTHRADAHAAAGERLRDATLAMVAQRLGLGGGPTVQEVLAALETAGVPLAEGDRVVLEHALGPEADGRDLTAHAAALARVRAAVRLGTGRAAPDDPPDDQPDDQIIVQPGDRPDDAADDDPSTEPT